MKQDFNTNYPQHYLMPVCNYPSSIYKSETIIPTTHLIKQQIKRTYYFYHKYSNIDTSEEHFNTELLTQDIVNKMFSESTLKQCLIIPMSFQGDDFALLIWHYTDIVVMELALPVIE